MLSLVYLASCFVVVERKLFSLFLSLAFLKRYMFTLFHFYILDLNSLSIRILGWIIFLLCSIRNFEVIIVDLFWIKYALNWNISHHCTLLCMVLDYTLLCRVGSLFSFIFHFAQFILFWIVHHKFVGFLHVL